MSPFHTLYVFHRAKTRTSIPLRYDFFCRIMIKKKTHHVGAS